MIHRLKHLRSFTKLGLFGILIIVTLVIILFNKPPVKKYSDILLGPRFQRRYELLQDTCSEYNFQLNKNTPTLITFTPLQLAYCKVPKITSSYWMRFFDSLASRTNETNPFNHIRYNVHRVQHLSLKVKVENIENKLIVTRNPYTRLFSAYVDKIFLSELWTKYGKRIIRNYRKAATPYSLKCGNDVKFNEFLEFITDKQNVNSDKHWKPITNICNPCYVNYNFVLNQETFSEDIKDFIHKIGIKKDNILNFNKLTHKEYAINAIRDLTLTSIIHFRKGESKICYKDKMLFSKLFSSFKIQGYIHHDAVFNSNYFKNASTLIPESVVLAFLKIYEKNPIEYRKEWEEQRKMYFVKAYRDIRYEILKKIKKIYFLDFKLFGYSMELDRT